MLEQGVPIEAIVTELVLSGEVERTYRLVRLEGGAAQMAYHSPTSQYGQMSRAGRYGHLDLLSTMRELVDDIASGRFADEWDAERDAGYPRSRLCGPRPWRPRSWPSRPTSVGHPSLGEGFNRSCSGSVTPMLLAVCAASRWPSSALRALRRKNDPATALRQPQYRPTAPLVAEAISEPCMDAVVNALGDAAEDPDRQQVLDALEEVQDRFPASTIALMLAYVSVTDMAAADVCAEILASDERFTPTP
jgi:hypothetical protein